MRQQTCLHAKGFYWNIATHMHSGIFWVYIWTLDILTWGGFLNKIFHLGNNHIKIFILVTEGLGFIVCLVLVFFLTFVLVFFGEGLKFCAQGKCTPLFHPHQNCSLSCHASAALLRSCNRNYMARKPRIFFIWPCAEVCWALEQDALGAAQPSSRGLLAAHSHPGQYTTYLPVILEATVLGLNSTSCNLVFPKQVGKEILSSINVIASKFLLHQSQTFSWNG